MNLLGQKKHTKDKAADTHTKKKIMMESIRLFALQGYHSVSMRELAKNIGIKPASIYSHYESKEALFQAILKQCATWYRAYFERLTAANKATGSLEELVENLFIELREVVDINVYYGISIIQSHKFYHGAAHELYFQLFHEESVAAIATYFDELIRNGDLAPFDTVALSRMFMNNVLIANELRIFEYMGKLPSLDISEFFTTLQSLIYHTAKGAPADAATS